LTACGRFTYITRSNSTPTKKLAERTVYFDTLHQTPETNKETAGQYRPDRSQKKTRKIIRRRASDEIWSTTEMQPSEQKIPLETRPAEPIQCYSTANPCDEDTQNRRLIPENAIFKIIHIMDLFPRTAITTNK
jgi:hypothetical protein